MCNRQIPNGYVRTLLSHVAVIAFCVLATLSGCAKESYIRKVGPTRAIWVTRWDYRSADDVKKVVENCASLGMNTIIFQVRGNGTVLYPSSIEPWAVQFDHKDPGFDPLALAIDEAHRRHIELHAWVNVMPAWRGEEPPKDRRQLFHTHPEWFLVDQQGNRQPLTDHYVILNPCLPEVRNYITEVFRELCANYDLDGLHMDYIRFVTHGSAAGVDYPYDKTTLDLFKKSTGKSPQEDPQAWDDWRRDAVTQLVGDINDMMEAVCPKAKLSASVFGNRKMVYESLFQAGDRWLAEGLIDIAFPMIYTTSTEDFIRMAEDWRSHSSGKPIVPGIGLYKHEDDATSIEQIRQAWSWGDGFCLFAYSSFFPQPPDPQKQLDQEQVERENERRHSRLNKLRPELLSLPAD